jgi:hypothetical protein
MDSASPSGPLLHLFYEEPDPDRWLPFDRYPRRLIRRLLRGPQRPGGVMRWFLNLRAGLDELGVPYVVNDYRSLRRSPGAVACVVGKSHVVEHIPVGHPIVYGPGITSHPCDDSFWGRVDIRLVLIPCQWFKEMYDRDLPVKVPTAVWPAGVETGRWRPEGGDRRAETGDLKAESGGQMALQPEGLTGRREAGARDRRPEVGEPSGSESLRVGERYDVLIYDKVRWEHERYERELIEPIRSELRRRGLSFREIRYGHYEEEDYRKALQECRAMIFLCEHETQGFAYLQALSCDVPVLAWDRGGSWQDPTYFPHRVKFAGVSSVPYWDDRCGVKFTVASGFSKALEDFDERRNRGALQPRAFVLENFDLADRAREYVNLAKSVELGRAVETSS